MIDFFWYPRCGTCQKAKKWLEANNISYEEIVEKYEPNGFCHFKLEGRTFNDSE